MLRKALLAAPLGVLLQLSWPSATAAFRHRRSPGLLAFAGCMPAARRIEVGPGVSADANPDITDLFIGTLSVVAGILADDLVFRFNRADGA